MSLEITLEKNSSYLPKHQISHKFDLELSAVLSRSETFRYLQKYPDIQQSVDSNELNQIKKDLQGLKETLLDMILPKEYHNLFLSSLNISLTLLDPDLMSIPWEILIGDFTSRKPTKRLIRKLKYKLLPKLDREFVIERDLKLITMLSSMPVLKADGVSDGYPEYCFYPDFIDFSHQLKNRFGDENFHFNWSANESTFNDLFEVKSKVVFLSAFYDDNHIYVESLADGQNTKIALAKISLYLRKAIENGLNLLVLTLEKAPDCHTNIYQLINKISPSLPMNTIVLQGRMQQNRISAYLYYLIYHILGGLPAEEAHTRSQYKLSELDSENWDWYFPMFIQNFASFGNDKHQIGLIKKPISIQAYEIDEEVKHFYPVRFPISQNILLNIKNRCEGKNKEIRIVSDSWDAIDAYIQNLFISGSLFEDRASMIIHLPECFWDLMKWFGRSQIDSLLPEMKDVPVYLASHVFGYGLGDNQNLNTLYGIGIITPRRLLDDEESILQLIDRKLNGNGPKILASHIEKNEPLSTDLTLSPQSINEILGNFSYPQREAINELTQLSSGKLPANSSIAMIFAQDYKELRSNPILHNSLINSNNTAEFISVYLDSILSNQDIREAILLFYIFGGMVDYHFLAAIDGKQAHKKNYTELIERGILICSPHGELIGLAENYRMMLDQLNKFDDDSINSKSEFVIQRISTYLKSYDPAYPRQHVFIRVCFYALAFNLWRKQYKHVAIMVMELLNAIVWKDKKQNALLKGILFTALMNSDVSSFQYHTLEKLVLVLLKSLSLPSKRSVNNKLGHFSEIKSNWPLLAVTLANECLFDYQVGDIDNLSKSLKRFYSFIYESQKKKYYQSAVISYLTIVYLHLGGKGLEDELENFPIYFEDLDDEKISKFWIFSSLSKQNKTDKNQDLLKAFRSKPDNYRETLVDALAYESAASLIGSSSQITESTKYLELATNIYAANNFPSKVIELRKKLGNELEQNDLAKCIESYLKLYEYVVSLDDHENIAACADKLGLLYYKFNDQENSTKFYSVAKNYVKS